MGKLIQKNKDKTSPLVSPARHTQQPVGLYSRYIQMKEDNTPLIRRRAASDYETYVHPKMDVVDSEDASEKEADATADQVMSTSESDMDEEKVQSKPLADSISRKGQSGESGVAVSGNTASYVGGLSGGQPLSQQEKSFHEPRFGEDFSNVRVHDDSKAHDAAQSINAKAFTSGNNIVFGKGQYSPDSVSGKHLMAHELTHTIQQQDDVQRIQRQQTPQSRNEQPDSSFFLGTQSLRRSYTERAIWTEAVLYNNLEGSGYDAGYKEFLVNRDSQAFIENVNCIGYGIISEAINPNLNAIAYILNLDRDQWETVKQLSIDPVVYDTIIYPFMQAAIGEFSYPGGVVPGPLSEETVQPFVDAFYGIESGPLNFPERHVYENYSEEYVIGSRFDLETYSVETFSGDAVAKFISMYQHTIMGTGSYLKDNAVTLANDMVGDRSVGGNGLQAVKMMFLSAYATAAKRIMEAALVDDQDPFNVHSDLVTEIRNAGYLMSGATEGYSGKIAEIREGIETIAGQLWDWVPISKVTGLLPGIGGQAIDFLIGQAKAPVINAISASLTSDLNDETLSQSKDRIMHGFRNELIGQFQNQFGSYANTSHSRKIEAGVGNLEETFG